jgi:hypothetical protein
MECFGLTELWMGIERVDGKIQSGVKPPQSKKPGSGISREGGRWLGWGLTRRREGAKKRKNEVFRGFPGPRCAVAQDVLWQ